VTKTDILHIQIDSDTKTDAEKLFSSFGISISDAVVMFLRKSLMVGGLPFELKNPIYSKTVTEEDTAPSDNETTVQTYKNFPLAVYNTETEAAIQEAKDIMAGKIKTKSYNTLVEFYTELMKEDAKT
jgi:DNA-damage-inducible protein J